MYSDLIYRKDLESDWNSNNGLLINESAHLSIGMFLNFIIQTILGFSFINLVTLQNVKRNPFLTKNDKYSKWNPYIGFLFLKNLPIY